MHYRGTGRAIIYAVATAALSLGLLGGNTYAQSFSDNFNRTDSVAVGNGWSDTAGNTAGNLSIQNDQLNSGNNHDVGNCAAAMPSLQAARLPDEVKKLGAECYSMACRSKKGGKK